MKILLVCSVTFVVAFAASNFWRPKESGLSQPVLITAEKVFQPSKKHSQPAPLTHKALIETEKNPFQRWDLLLKQGEHMARPQMRQILVEMLHADTARAWLVLTTGKVKMQTPDIELFAETFADKNGPEAAAFGLAFEDEHLRKFFLNHVMTTWLLRNPGECLTWVKKQPQPHEMADFFRVQLGSYNLDRFTLDDVKDIVPLYPPSSFLPTLAGGAVKRVLRDPSQLAPAIAWGRQLPSSDVKDAVLVSCVEHQADGDAAAASELAEEISAPHLRRKAISNIAARMAKVNTAGALEFAASIADAETARTAWQSALSTWAAQKPEETVAYVSEHVQQITPDMLTPLAHQWARHNPPEVFQLAARFPMSHQREVFLKEMIEAWMRFDSDRAREWLESTSPALIFSAAEVQKLLQASDRVARTRMSGGALLTIDGRKVGWMF